jgi:hypothetical protein
MHFSHFCATAEESSTRETTTFIYAGENLGAEVRPNRRLVA